MRSRPSTRPLLLSELVRLDPLASAQALHLPATHQSVHQVVLAETLDRLRRTPPHSLVVLHAEAATGGWSLAAALHLAWERNLAGVVVTRAVAGPSGAELARRLNLCLLVIDADPVDVALALAGQVSTPDAARALRQALCAEELAEQRTVRGVLGVLNRELEDSPVALVLADAVLAGRAAALTQGADTVRVSVEVDGPGGQPGACLVAAVPTAAAVTVPQVETVLRLGRPALLAAWARTRLNAAAQAAAESAAFGLLRTVAEPSHRPAGGTGAPEPIDPPAWGDELGWRLDEHNLAVWVTPVRPAGPAAEDLTHLVRRAWQRGHPSWPLIAQDDGWISWQSDPDPEQTGPVRRALTTFRDTAESHQLVVGVGRAHPGVAGLFRSVAQARLAAHVARRRGAGAIQWFDQVGAAAALAWLPIPEIAGVAELGLPELSTATDRNVLVDTVLAVLDHGGSLAEAAHRLGVHRNTVLGRLTRARSLGLLIDDPDQRLAVHVLCYALATDRR